VELIYSLSTFNSTVGLEKYNVDNELLSGATLCGGVNMSLLIAYTEQLKLYFIFRYGNSFK